MASINDYETFCEEIDRKNVKLDAENVSLKQKAKELGWSVGMFTAERDILAKCRESAENFDNAHRTIDFHTKS